MVKRPVFLRGLRRWLVRFDVNQLEFFALVAFLAVSLLFVARTVFGAPEPVACDAPNDRQVLVWAWRDDGAASCQYLDR